MANATDPVLKKIDTDGPQAVYLVSGDLVVAEARATRIAEAVAQKMGCEVETRRRPAHLGDVFADLRTFSLFASAKVILAVDTAVLADSRAAAELIDQAATAVPLANATDELDSSGRQAASRLLQALHVFGLDTRSASAEELMSSLPKWALQGGTALRKKKPRGRPAKESQKLLKELTVLLDAGRDQGLLGFAEGDLAELGELVQGGLPDGHCLVLAEQSVAANHPVAQSLAERGALIETARVAAGKGGDWQGLAGLISELKQETGVAIARDAVAELARRTLRQTGDFKSKSAGSDSTARFAGEYRKLATLAQSQSGGISRQLVADSVKDRGEEDVWKILDALGNGRGGEAVSRYRRLIASANDPMAARLSFFSLLAGFCRQLSAVAGMARYAKVPPGVRNYNQFKDRWAPRLQGDAPFGGKNPLAGLHPFRLHRAYLAASQVNRDELLRLPWRVLETEMRIKGEASDPDTAVSSLLSHLCASRI